jgi:quinol-cytochrome oxidoreductase complex cytochrome b subunit
MHAPAVAGTILWFALVGLLWYVRPGEIAWFVGSLALGAIYFTAFFWYVTRRR